MPTNFPKRIASSGLEGDPKELTFQGVTTPGVLQTPISLQATIPIGKIWNIHQVFVSCRTELKFEVKKDSVIIGSGRTGPASPMGYFQWAPSKKILEGEVVKIEFKSVSGTPIIDVEAYLHASEVDA